MAITVLPSPASQWARQSESDSLDQMAIRLSELQSKAVEMRAALKLIEEFEVQFARRVIAEFQNGQPLPIQVPLGGQDWRCFRNGGVEQARQLPPNSYHKDD